MGIDRSPAELLDAAREALAEQQAAMAALVGVARFADALPRLRAAGDGHLEAGEVESAYRDANQRCVAFVHEQGLFELPADFTVPLSVVPPELGAVTHAGNVPAPLFGDGGGSFAVLDVPERHRRAWVVPLAVHEGVPGHYLQSRIWQQTFRGRGTAPEFVSFADPIAAERQDWGAMPAIEGWAVYAEELVRRAGMHAPEQELAVRTFHAIRCARTIVDVGLHTGRLSLDAARAGAGRRHRSRPLRHVPRAAALHARPDPADDLLRRLARDRGPDRRQRPAGGRGAPPATGLRADLAALVNSRQGSARSGPQVDAPHDPRLRTATATARPRGAEPRDGAARRCRRRAGRVAGDRAPRPRPPAAACGRTPARPARGCSASAGDDADRAELLQAIATAVAELPPPAREVVLLRHYDGLPLRESAVQLGLSV